jgi:alanine racemase
MDAYRVRAEIDLDALTHNLAAIRRRVGPRIAVMLVVKADAYGHGAVAVAHHALRCGIAALGVGTSAEALELRRSGVRAPILVLGTIVDDEAADALRHDVHIALHSEDRCESLQELARALKHPARVHLKIDSGMGRLGVLPNRALDLMERICASSHVELRGVMTHIGSAIGALDPTTSQQLAVFEDLVSAARAAGLLGDAWVHAANSACIFTGLHARGDLVRPGISAYGVLPAHLSEEGELLPVMSLATQVVFLKDLPRGAPVGYEATWRAPHPTRIATLPVGYNDGVSWRLSNRGEVLIRGRRAPIVGRVSMDYTTVDVGHIPGVSVGDRVTLIGRQGEERIGLEEVARRADTIPYEIACAVGKRVERTYHGGEVTLFPAPRPASAEAGHTQEQRSARAIIE